MKKLIYVSVLLMMLVSCKKENMQIASENKLLSAAENLLKDSLNKADLVNLDFDHSILSDYGNMISIMRIPFKNKPQKENFVLVKFENGKATTGKIISLLRSKNMDNGSNLAGGRYNGEINIQYLNRAVQCKSLISNGYIEAWHDKKRAESFMNIVDPYTNLPEVVVFGYYGGSGISWSFWLNLLSLLDGGYGGNYGSSYTQLDTMDSEPGSGGGGGGGGYGGGGNTVVINFENQYANPPINLEDYMRCFSNIPDAGATGSIEIFTDLPVRNDPTIFFDWSVGSPGHTFIKLTKQNGAQYAQQYIGFYPVSGWKTTITTAPVAGKFVDNAGHEFNGSYKISLNPTQINSAVTEILYLGRFVLYDIDEFNCTDWALDVFNKVANQDQKLNIPTYQIPGGMAPLGTRTPQGLYQKLQQIKAAGGPEANNVNLPIVGGAGASSGPCN